MTAFPDGFLWGAATAGHQHSAIVEDSTAVAGSCFRHRRARDKHSVRAIDLRTGESAIKPQATGNEHASVFQRNGTGALPGGLQASRGYPRIGSRGFLANENGTQRRSQDC